eukprot:s1135_g10.t2
MDVRTWHYPAHGRRNQGIRSPEKPWDFAHLPTEAQIRVRQGNSMAKRALAGVKEAFLRERYACFEHPWDSLSWQTPEAIQLRAMPGIFDFCCFGGQGVLWAGLLHNIPDLHAALHTPVCGGHPGIWPGQQQTYGLLFPSRDAGLDQSWIKIGDPEAKSVKARLGSHGGNSFTVLLRDTEQAEAEEAVAAVAGGFPNYFGLQRFGTGQQPSSSLGLALLRGDFAELVMLALGARARRGRALEAFQAAQEGRFEAALEMTPSSCLQERAVLQHLVQSPSDFTGAVKAIPRHLRLLWCRSLASHVWNRVLSLRIQQKMMEPLPGDLVLDRAASAEEARDLVRALREGEEKDTAMAEILLPVPGYDVPPPTHAALRQIYQRIMEEMGIDGQVFRKPESPDDIWMSGGYRPAICHFSGLSHRFIPSSPRAPLIPNDLHGPAPGPRRRPQGTALLLEFRLPKASYATMAIREVMKKMR